MGNKRNRQKRVKGSDMGKGVAKRKRPRVESEGFSDDDRRKTSVPCVERVKVPDDDWKEDSTRRVKWKGYSYDDENMPYVEWEGSLRKEDSSPRVKWKGYSYDDENMPYVEWEGSLRKEDSTPRVKWKGYSYDDENMPYVEWEGSLRKEDSTPRVKWKGYSYDDENMPYVEWEGSLRKEDSTRRVKWKGYSYDDENMPYVEWEGSLRKEDSTPRVKWKGYSYDEENMPYVKWEGSLRKEDSTPRKQVELIRSSADDGEPGVSEDELLRQHLEKVGTTASGDCEQALQRTLDQFPSASTDMKQSGRKEIDGRRFAEIFSLQGNNAMQSKLYAAAIDYYNAAIVLGGDKAIYYCNRAAAYIQTCQYAEAILDCKKSIAIDPNYIEAYVHLGYICFGLGIDAALEKGYIATHLDPTNESVRAGVRAAEHKVCQQRKESGQNSNWSYSSGVMSVRDQVPPPFFGDKSGAAGELHEAIRAAYHVALHYKTTTLM